MTRSEVNSHDLRAGDVVIGQDGRAIRIERIGQRWEDDFPVANLTIGEYHNFAVGEAGVLVHNVAICDKAVELVSDLIRWRKLDLEKAVDQLVKGGVDDKLIRKVLDRVDDLGPWKFGPSAGAVAPDKPWWRYMKEDLGIPIPDKNKAPWLYKTDEYGKVTNELIDDLHGHHIAFKEGASVAQRVHSIRARRVLEEYGIDWYLVGVNLVYAPNTAHTGANIKKLADELVRLKSKDESLTRIKRFLKAAGKRFADTGSY